MPASIIDNHALAIALHEKIQKDRRLGIDMQDLADEIGVTRSELLNLLSGDTTHANTFVTVTSWLGIPSDQFVSPRRDTSSSAPVHFGDDREAFGKRLRDALDADPNLNKESADAIAYVLLAAWDKLGEPSAAISSVRPEGS